jgi:hypothetical protein
MALKQQAEVQSIACYFAVSGRWVERRRLLVSHLSNEDDQSL